MKTIEKMMSGEKKKSKMLSSLNVDSGWKENILRNSDEEFLAKERYFNQKPDSKRKSCHVESMKTLTQSTRYSTKEFQSKPQNSQNCLTHRNSQKNFKRFSDLKQKVQVENRANVSHSSVTCCENHPDREGKYCTLSEDENLNNEEKFHEQSFYCEECAINLSQMDFIIRKSSKNHESSPYLKLLDELFRCQEELVAKIEEDKDNSMVRMIDIQIQDIEEKYENIFNALEKMKKDQILKYEIKKMEMYERISDNESIIQGLKRKIVYLISDLGKKLKQEQTDLKTSFKYEICEQLYLEVIEKTRRSLGKLKRDHKRRPSILQKIKKMSEMEICEKIKEFFEERVHELSFSMDKEDSLSRSEILEATQPLSLNPNQNVLELSEFEATFGNNSLIYNTDLEYSGVTPRLDAHQEVKY